MRSGWRGLPFLLIFPGYFAYHWSALNGWTPLFAGGYVNEAAAAVCLGLALALGFCLLTRHDPTLAWTTLDIGFMGFMAWFALVALFHALLQTTPGVTRDHLASWVQLLACYVAVRHLPLDRLTNTCLVLAAAFSASVLWAAQNDLLSLLLAASDNSSAATYQGLARAYLVTAAFGIAGQGRRLDRSISMLVTLFVLFLVGARSEIVGAAVLFGVMEVAMSKDRMRATLVAATMVAVLGLAVIAALDTLGELFPDNRFLVLLVKGSGDSSLTERTLYQDFGWQAILNSPWLGDYGHYERAFSSGAYIHNWLSVWVDLGIIGVAIFVLLLVLSAHAAMQDLRHSDCSGDSLQRRLAALSLGLLAAIVVLMLFAKPFADTGLATVTGLLAARARRWRSVAGDGHAGKAPLHGAAETPDAVDPADAPRLPGQPPAHSKQ